MPGAHVLPDPKRYAVEPMTGLEVYKIGREAIITLQPSTGYVAVSCPWHPELNGCHWWNARGSESLHQFLCSIDRHYTMGKLFDRRSLEEFDEEASIASLKRETLARRRNKEITSDEARDLWDQAEGCSSPEEIAQIHDEYGNTYYEHICNRPKSCADWFWNEVWAAFIAHIRTACLANASDHRADQETSHGK